MSIQVFPTAPSPTVTHLINLAVLIISKNPFVARIWDRRSWKGQDFGVEYLREEDGFKRHTKLYKKKRDKKQRKRWAGVRLGFEQTNCNHLEPIRNDCKRGSWVFCFVLCFDLGFFFFKWKIDRCRWRWNLGMGKLLGQVEVVKWWRREGIG